MSLSVVAVALALLLLVVVVLVTRVGSGDQAVDDSQRLFSSGLEPATPPSPPRALPRNGALVDAVIQADGTVQVTHWLRSNRAIDEITLRAGAGPVGTGRAEDLEVRTSQGMVAVDDPTVGPSPRRLDLVRPTLLARLDYTLVGVSETSPDSPGRALLDAVALITASPQRSSRTVVQVTGQDVLALACSRPDQGAADERPCGRPVQQGWSVDLRARDASDVVRVQVDLDDAGS